MLRGGAAVDDVAAWVWRSSFRIAGGLLEARRRTRRPGDDHAAERALGPDGIVNRARYPSATVFPYLGIDAWSTQSPGEPPPFVATLHFTSTDDVTVTAGDGRTWRLGIEAAPDRASPYLGPSPALPGPDGSIVYWTHVGPNARSDMDFGEPTMSVLDVLGADQAVDWRSLPEGWDVVSSDVWGTVLGRVVDGQLELALADFATVD